MFTASHVFGLSATVSTSIVPLAPKSPAALPEVDPDLAAHPQRAETRKKLVQERSATMPKDDAGRKKLALQSREGYLKMYRAYCAQPAPANPAVCSNESLKKVYDNIAKSIQTTKA